MLPKHNVSGGKNESNRPSRQVIKREFLPQKVRATPKNDEDKKQSEVRFKLEHPKQSRRFRRNRLKHLKEKLERDQQQKKKEKMKKMKLGGITCLTLTIVLSISLPFALKDTGEEYIDRMTGGNLGGNHSNETSVGVNESHSGNPENLEVEDSSQNEYSGNGSNVYVGNKETNADSDENVDLESEKKQANTTILVNATNTTILVNATNTTILANATNTTILANATNTTILANATNTTILANATNTTTDTGSNTGSDTGSNTGSDTGSNILTNSTKTTNATQKDEPWYAQYFTPLHGLILAICLVVFLFCSIVYCMRKRNPSSPDTKDYELPKVSATPDGRSISYL